MDIFLSERGINMSLMRIEPIIKKERSKINNIRFRIENLQKMQWKLKEQYNEMREEITFINTSSLKNTNLYQYKYSNE